MKAAPSSLRPGTRQVLLGFSGVERHLPSERGLRTLQSFVNNEFKPLGLFVWGSTNETLIHGVRVGNQSEVEVSGGYGPIPASYFETGRTLAELTALAESGELERAVELRQLTSMHVAFPGNSINVAIEGPFERVCMWGLVSDGPPSRLVRVEQQTTIGAVPEGKTAETRWLGEVIERELSGDRASLEVVGPSAEVVAQLLIGLSAR